MSKTILLDKAVEVWAHIRAAGRTDLEYYDSGLEDELRRRLSLPEGALGDSLATYEITVEAFLLAFFRCVQPFVDMMGELLAMYEQAGASVGNENLAVKFDFGREHAGLQFDLRHFRQWVEGWRKGMQIVEEELWNYSSLWKLNSALRPDVVGFRESNAELVEPLLREWIRSEPSDQWQRVPQAPRAAFADLDGLFSRVWNVLIQVFDATRSLARDHDTLMRMRFPDAHSRGVEFPVREFPPSLLRFLESDYWARSLIIGAYSQAQRLQSLEADEKTTEAAALAAELRSVFDDVPKGRVAVSTLIRTLDEILQLPLWKWRYELYSAWVAARIASALNGYGLRIHHDNGMLSFSFTGTHFATCDNLQPRLHIWAEMRSPLEEPKGKGRKKAIQPDYTLVADPITGMGSAVLVVECKQYRRASTNSFAAALDDYARGRPTAQVVLVNYGPARPEIVECIPDLEIRSRVRIIGELHPGNPAALKAFNDVILNAVELRYPGNELASACARSVSAPFKVTLTWDAQPSDLDLHMEIGGEPQGRNRVTFSSRGLQNDFPWATYGDDVRTGYGPEQIEVHRMEGRVYRFAVHKFSSDQVPIAGCGARVTVTTMQGVVVLDCPATGEGNWWELFTVDGRTGTLSEVNEIMHALPPL